MHSLVMFTICAAAVCEFLATLWPAAGLVKFVPEVLSVVVASLVLLEGIRNGFKFVAPKYWLAFGLAVFIIVCGILTNSVGAGPIVAGMRSYLRAIPMFMIPAVFPFTDKQVERQIKVVLALGLLQLPLACYQRWIVWSQDRFSGDSVSGTAMDSGILSVALICIAVVLLGFFMRKRIGTVPFVVLFLMLLFPTTINETKATVLLLPIGLLTTVVAGSPRGKRMKVFGLGVSLLVVFGSIMIPVYNLMQQNNPYKGEKNLVDFFTSEKQINNYMSVKGGATVGTMHAVRRGDAIRVPLEYLSQDPVRLAFGLGLGSASHSNLGQAFVGTYFDLFRYFAYLSVSVFLLEIGVLGTGLVFLLYALVFFDAIAVARSDPGVTGALAIGWIGVVAVIAAATFYSAIHVYPILSYLYWYFAGVVAARRTQLVLANSTAQTAGTVPRRQKPRFLPAAQRCACLNSAEIASGDFSQLTSTPCRRARR